MIHPPARPAAIRRPRPTRRVAVVSTHKHKTKQSLQKRISIEGRFGNPPFRIRISLSLSGLIFYTKMEI